MRATTTAERGRRAYAQRRWGDAYMTLTDADREQPLDCNDLEALAWCAALTGRDEIVLTTFERLYHAHTDAGRHAAAARAAFWLGFRLLSLGEMGRAGGWLGYAQRAVDAAKTECSITGWLLLPEIHRLLSQGDHATASAAAVRAAAVGERCDDQDLIAFARNLQGRALTRVGDIDAGLALIDEVMVSVLSDRLSPLVTGLVYCSVIASCQQVFAIDRAREWTAALTSWCDTQPQLVAFTATCLVHRAEILQLSGAWQEAADEAQRASERCSAANAHANVEAAGDAHYQDAEIHRLRGEFDAAEHAYRAANSYGREPQPGLALLRLAQGRQDAAAAALRRVLAVTSAPLQRARFLPAQVDVMLAIGDVDAARELALELSSIAKNVRADVLHAMAAHAQGAVALAQGDAQAAVPLLRIAFRLWQGFGAPYFAACARVLLGRACTKLGDDEGHRLEFDAARSVFQALGAVPEIADLDRLDSAARGLSAPGLTARECEVLRLVSSGASNKAIARDLRLSERTIDRHVSNILSKLDVRSRAAATAYAYQHGLV